MMFYVESVEQFEAVLMTCPPIRGRVRQVILRKAVESIVRLLCCEIL